MKAYKANYDKYTCYIVNFDVDSPLELHAHLGEYPQCLDNGRLYFKWFNGYQQDIGQTHDQINLAVN